MDIAPIYKRAIVLQNEGDGACQPFAPFSAGDASISNDCRTLATKNPLQLHAHS